MKSFLRVAAVLGVLVGLALAVLLGPAGPAGAAPYSGAASLSVSQSNPCHGAPVTLTGVGYVPGSTVVLTLDGTVLGRAKVDANGAFSIRVTVPDSARGTKTIIATGPSGGRIASTQIVVGACGNGGTDPGGSGAEGAGAGSGSGGGTGGLSSTGVAVIAMLVVAVGLIGSGLVLVVGGRRRRTSAGTA